jgi:hypothetical protein
MPIATDGYSLQSEPLLAGDDGTAQTVRAIRALVEQGKKDPRVNRTTGGILRAARVAPYDDAAEVRAIFSWVLRNIRFTKDPEGKECLRPAATTLQWGFGDCDDINAILLPSMLGSVGYRTRVVTIASHPGAPEQFSHVYCEVHLAGRWIPLDAARKGTSFGSAPARRFRKRVWSLISDDYQDLRGMPCGSSAGCSMRRRTLGTHMRLNGLGRYYRASGLGDGFDWGAFTDVVDSAGKAATSIVAASRAPAGVVYPAMSTYPPVGVAPGIGPGGGVSAVGSISSNTLVWVGIAALGTLLLLRRP